MKTDVIDLNTSCKYSGINDLYLRPISVVHILPRLAHLPIFIYAVVPCFRRYWD